MNGATQNRYLTAKLAAESGQLATGIQIIDTLENLGEKTDGYRVVAQGYTAATDVRTAFEWAKSLPNNDQQLAACVGILQAVCEKLTATEEVDALTKHLLELQSLGRPVFLWGC